MRSSFIIAIAAEADDLTKILAESAESDGFLVEGIDTLSRLVALASSTADEDNDASAA